jgi:hypothetical protein
LSLIIATAGWDGWYFRAQTHPTQPIVHPFQPIDFLFTIIHLETCTSLIWNVSSKLELKDNFQTKNIVLSISFKLYLRIKMRLRRVKNNTRSKEQNSKKIYFPILTFLSHPLDFYLCP